MPIGGAVHRPAVAAGAGEQQSARPPEPAGDQPEDLHRRESRPGTVDQLGTRFQLAWSAS